MIHFSFDLPRRLRIQQFGVFSVRYIWGKCVCYWPAAGQRERGDRSLEWRRGRLRMCCGMKAAEAALLGAVWSLGCLEPFPLYSVF